VAKQFTLGRQERLKSRKSIDQLFSEGQRFSQPPIRILYRKTSSTGLKYGVAVSSKLFKKAVDRNRVKRVLREAWRLQKNEFEKQLTEKGQGLDVFFIYTDKELPVSGIISKVTGIIIRKLNERVNG
jgi:ribonuclease P protein component